MPEDVADALDASTKPRAATRLPSWLKVRLPGDGQFFEVRRKLGAQGLHTVCEEARCPNIAECWGAGTATFMILGSICTRGCRFCDVTTGRPQTAPDPDEPRRVASAAAAMGLRYVVLTSVDRDDLPDGGAEHFVQTVGALRQAISPVVVEVLTPDFAGQAQAITRAYECGAEVLAHNVETVPRLQRGVRDVRCSFERSLDVLRSWRAAIDASGERRLLKSSLLLGLGETDDEIVETLGTLRQAGVDWVTLGQYLRPSHKHLPVARYVSPAEFAALEARARELGFAIVTAGPLVRSSYRAAEQQAQAWLQR